MRLEAKSGEPGTARRTSEMGGTVSGTTVAVHCNPVPLNDENSREKVQNVRGDSSRIYISRKSFSSRFAGKTSPTTSKTWSVPSSLRISSSRSKSFASTRPSRVFTATKLKMRQSCSWPYR